jgi:hypothetical protein
MTTAPPTRPIWFDWIIPVCLLLIGFALGWGAGRQGPERRAADSDRLIEALRTYVQKMQESIDQKDEQLGELAQRLQGCKGVKKE